MQFVTCGYQRTLGFGSPTSLGDHLDRQLMAAED